MFTRVIQRKRPRPAALLLIGAAIVAAGLAAAVVVAVTVYDTGTGSPTFTGNCDVTVASNSTSADCQLGTAGAKVSYIGSNDTARQASGTGLFDPFVRLQGSPTEQGYNTCSQASCGGDVSQFDTKTGSWTHAIKVNAIPLVACNRFTGDTAECWEIFNDINDNNTAKRISLNIVQIFFSNSAVLTGYTSGPPPAFSTPAGNTTTLEYDFHGNILINDVNSGSGRGDLRYLVPTTGHTWDDSTWFVLYSKWGTTPSSVTATAGTGGWASDGGFEEWKVRKTPNVHITKTADAASVSAGTAIGFTITVTNGGVADATGVTISDPLPGGTGVTPVHWTESPDNSNCTISGSDGSQSLSCGPVTLAAGGGSLSVHVSASTTGDNCGIYDNTATFTSTNAGTGSASDSITVLCPDVRVVKTPDSEATGAGTVGAGSDAVFTIVTSNIGAGTAMSVTLTDNLPAGSGPLHWTIDTDATTLCSISGADGSQVLSCPYGDLAPSASRTVIVKATTSGGDCFLNGNTGDIENTASASATNEASTTLTNNSDHGDVNVTCSAIQILKESTKTGNPLVLVAGAVFHVTGPGGYSADVTDNGTGDEFNTGPGSVGAVCISGLVPGEYTVTETTPPDGYGSGTAVDDTSTAANGTDCGSHKPSTADSAVFTDPPLSDIQVNFRDGGSGETTATISCDNTTGTQSTTPANGWDTTDTEIGVNAPTVVHCTITIDP